jgi:hypothetical protein
MIIRNYLIGPIFENYFSFEVSIGGMPCDPRRWESDLGEEVGRQDWIVALQ